mmetsp:Transcript_23938/g.55254  ORF Transcript_23938/g.55254 Transcript_23938/m.55254 type:complete len:154 (+) Transcript_23938:89-550(+)
MDVQRLLSKAAVKVARPRRSISMLLVTAMALGAALLAATTRGTTFAVVRGTGHEWRGAVVAAERSTFIAGSRPSARGDASQVVLAREAGASWLPALPQTCSDDYECNDGKANFPLQCCEVMMMKFCCEPDDFMPTPNRPAFVPIPVPVDTPYE